MYEVDKLRKEIMKETHFLLTVFVKVSYLSLGEVGTSEALWIVAAITYPEVEVGLGLLWIL